MFLSNLFSQFSPALTMADLLHPDQWNLWFLWQVQINYIPSVCTTHIQDSLCIQNMKVEIDKVVPALKCTSTLIKSNIKSIKNLFYFSKKAWMSMCITLYTVKENCHSYHNSLHLQRRRYLFTMTKSSFWAHRIYYNKF